MEQERPPPSIGDAVITTDAGHGGISESDRRNSARSRGTRVPGHLLGARSSASSMNRSGCAEVDLAACVWKKQTIKLPEHSLLVGHTGREYAIRASAAPIRDEQGRMLGVVLAISDLSEGAA